MLIKEGIAQSVAVLGAPSSAKIQVSLCGVLNLETSMHLFCAIRPVLFLILLSQSHDPGT